MDPTVLLEVIATTESFRTNGARERTKSCVDALVSRQFFIAGERFAARFFFAFEWSFAYFK